MLSSVFLSGRLGKSLSSHVRNVEIDRVMPGCGGKFVVDIFPVYCPLSSASLFFTAKEGSLIILKGRLEKDKEFGALIVDEIDEIFPAAGEGR